VISESLWLVGPDRALNPEKYYIILTALFGNSESSSPSNTPSLRPFPPVTFYDNVRAQHHLITQHLKITHVRAVLGWSMGAAQTYQWATQYPTFMDVAIPFCGSAKTSPHNQVMLEGVKAALLSAQNTTSAGVGKVDAKTPDGVHLEYTDDSKRVALKTLARVYAGWGFSQTFYRQKLYTTVLKHASLDAFLVDFWETWTATRDPENMLVMAHTWQVSDVSQQEAYGGDFDMAMKAIRAKMLVMPGKTDLYFPPEDSEIEVSSMREGVGELRVIPSVWGHWAGGPGGCKEDLDWLDGAFKEWLEKA
jgi:homoserine acetyltransferase